MIVSAFMIPAANVVKCAPDDSIENAIDKCLDYNISSVVVVNESEEAVGMVTKTDLVKAYKDGKTLDSAVEDVMSADLKTLKPDTSRDSAANVFEKNKIHHAVVADKSGKFLGLVSSWDIAKECAEDSKAWPWNRHQGGKVPIADHHRRAVAKQQ